MTTDDLRTRAREAAWEYAPGWVNGTVPMPRDVEDSRELLRDGFEDGYLAHAAQQPSRDIDVDELARVIGGIHKRETETYGQYDRRRARAVRNYLLTGDESDE